jgi:hypothetical protein
MQRKTKTHSRVPAANCTKLCVSSVVQMPPPASRSDILTQLGRAAPFILCALAHAVSICKATGAKHFTKTAAAYHLVQATALEVSPHDHKHANAMMSCWSSRDICGSLWYNNRHTEIYSWSQTCGLSTVGTVKATFLHVTRSGQGMLAVHDGLTIATSATCQQCCSTNADILCIRLPQLWHSTQGYPTFIHRICSDTGHAHFDDSALYYQKAAAKQQLVAPTHRMQARTQLAAGVLHHR